MTRTRSTGSDALLVVATPSISYTVLNASGWLQTWTLYRGTVLGRNGRRGAMTVGQLVAFIDSGDVVPFTPTAPDPTATIPAGSVITLLPWTKRTCSGG